MARVLVLSDLWLPFPGGAERLMFNLARDLQARGHLVGAVTGYEYPQEFDGVPVRRAELPDDDGGRHRLRVLVQAHRPDVLVVHHHWARLHHATLTGLGVPIVEVVLNGQRMPEAELAIFISDWVARQGGCKPGDLVLHPYAQADIVAASHGPAIGFIKPYPHKGAERVYRIAKAMPRRQFLVLRGEWPTIEVLPEWPLPNLRFMPAVDDIRTFYAEVRLLLMPSQSEDAGTVAQEATANGLPCISTNVGGLAETNAGGIQLHPDSPTARWVRAIRHLDHPHTYGWRVQRQQAARRDPSPVLDAIAERIAELA